MLTQCQGGKTSALIKKKKKEKERKKDLFLLINLGKEIHYSVRKFMTVQQDD